MFGHGATPPKDGEAAPAGHGHGFHLPSFHLPAWIGEWWTQGKAQARDAVVNGRDAGLAGASALSESFKQSTEALAHEARTSAQAVSSTIGANIATGLAHASALQGQIVDQEEAFFARCREIVKSTVMHQPQATALAVVASVVLLLPVPRAFLLRRVLGPLRSEDAIFKSAERRSAALKESLGTQEQESQKLAERAALARDELSRGQSKLRATATQLESLARTVRRGEASAAALAAEIKGLSAGPRAAAAPLAKEVAETASRLSTQRLAVERALYSVIGTGAV